MSKTKIVVTFRSRDVHAAIDGTSGKKWGCGRTPDEAIGALVRSHPEAFDVDLQLPSSAPAGWTDPERSSKGDEG